VPVPASGGSRGHRRARRSRRRERRASRRRGDADSPREESEVREERARRRCGGEPRARRERQRVRANELGQRRRAVLYPRFQPSDPTVRWERGRGSNGHLRPSRAVVGPAHIACRARVGTTGQNGGPGTDTKAVGSGHSWAVLIRVVLGPAHSARARQNRSTPSVKTALPPLRC